MPEDRDHEEKRRSRRALGFAIGSTRTVGRRSRQLVADSFGLLCGTLDRFASEPEECKSTARQISDLAVSLIPVISSSKEYADARKKYQRGREDSSDLLVKEARKDCVLAMVGLGIDITSLGVGGRTVRLTSRVLRALALTRPLGRLSKRSELDLFSRMAANALRIPYMSQLVDELLKGASKENSK